MEDENLLENNIEWLAQIEDITDKISFQLHELFSFYEDEEIWGIVEKNNFL